ncbi:hypothetical protein ABEB36_008328 [Hypothenemus hampei]|uniref:Uncharacterized protein n=1 Tax=Hypothenemus hampei TaxID=57062 RepID=A0ABD1ELX8_HYPHA
MMKIDKKVLKTCLFKLILCLLDGTTSFSDRGGAHIKCMSYIRIISSTVNSGYNVPGSSLSLPLFDKNLCLERWYCEQIINNTQTISTPDAIEVTSEETNGEISNIRVIQMQNSKPRTLSNHEKFRLMNQKGIKIAEISSDISTASVGVDKLSQPNIEPKDCNMFVGEYNVGENVRVITVKNYLQTKKEDNNISIDNSQSHSLVKEITNNSYLHVYTDGTRQKRAKKLSVCRILRCLLKLKNVAAQKDLEIRIMLRRHPKKMPAPVPTLDADAGSGVTSFKKYKFHP